MQSKLANFYVGRVLSRRARRALADVLSLMLSLVAACLLSALAAGGPAAESVVLDGDLDTKPMPRVGFGTCCRASAKGKPLVASTLEFLKQGGRLIDTAQM